MAPEVQKRSRVLLKSKSFKCLELRPSGNTCSCQSLLLNKVGSFAGMKRMKLGKSKMNLLGRNYLQIEWLMGDDQMVGYLSKSQYVIAELLLVLIKFRVSFHYTLVGRWLIVHYGLVGQTGRICSLFSFSVFCWPKREREVKVRTEIRICKATFVTWLFWTKLMISIHVLLTVWP